jgi:hypothetical protein
VGFIEVLCGVEVVDEMSTVNATFGYVAFMSISFYILINITVFGVAMLRRLQLLSGCFFMKEKRSMGEVFILYKVYIIQLVVSYS